MIPAQNNVLRDDLLALHGYMPYVDLAAIQAIRGDAGAACRSLRTAIALGWRYPSLAARDRLFENLRTVQEFLSLVAA